MFVNVSFGNDSIFMAKFCEQIKLQLITIEELI